MKTWLGLFLILFISEIARGDGGSAHAVLRLGNRSGIAVVLPCLTAAELNAAAVRDDNGRPFGWQLRSPDFSCRGNLGSIAGLSVECTYEDDEPRFMDFFFTSLKSCQNFQKTIASACNDAPADQCLSLMETLFTAPTQAPETDPI